MTKLDQVKADLIDIIGDRKTVNIKEVSHLARSSVLIDDLMANLGYYRSNDVTIYTKQAKIEHIKPKAKPNAKKGERKIEVKYGSRKLQFQLKNGVNRCLMVCEHLLKYGSITTTEIVAMDVSYHTQCINNLRRKGLVIDVEPMGKKVFRYTLKMP